MTKCPALFSKENGAKTKLDEMKEYQQERIIDQSQTENFMLQMVVTVSDLVFFVVNDYTWLEQDMVYNVVDILGRLQRQDVALQKRKKISKVRNRNLVVINNMRFQSNKENATKQFREVELMYRGSGRYGQDEGDLFRKVDVKRDGCDGGNSCAIEHYGFMRELPGEDNEGRQHNKRQVENIKRQPFFQPQNYHDEKEKTFKDRFDRGLRRALEEFVELVDIKNDTCRMSSKRLADTDEDGNHHLNLPLNHSAVQKKHRKMSLFLNVKEDVCMKRRKEGLINEFGELVVVDGLFNPPPPLEYKIKEEDENGKMVEKCIYQIDLPGVEEGYWQITRTDDSGARVLQLVVTRNAILPWDRQPIPVKNQKMRNDQGTITKPLPEDCFPPHNSDDDDQEPAYKFVYREKDKKENFKEYSKHVKFELGVLTLTSIKASS